jgi:hypothetical protein
VQARTACLKDKGVKMSEFPEFLMKITKATNSPEEGLGMMSVIVQRPYAYLEKELCGTFEGQEDVKVVVDRRHSERRTRTQPAKLERRRADRRRRKEELAEVLLLV